MKQTKRDLIELALRKTTRDLEIAEHIYNQAKYRHEQAIGAYKKLKKE